MPFPRPNSLSRELFLPKRDGGCLQLWGPSMPASIPPQKDPSSCEGDKEGFLQGWVFSLCPHPSPSPRGMPFIQLPVSEHRAKEEGIALSFPKSLLSLNPPPQRPLKCHHSPERSPMNMELQMPAWAEGT